MTIDSLITVRPASLKVPFKEACERFRNIRSKICRFLQRRTNSSGLELAFIWAIENPDCRSLHLHIGTQVDAEQWIKLRPLIEKWVDQLLGSCDDGSVHLQALGDRRSQTDYIVKGADPEYAEKVNLKFADQGRIWGKRSGFSQNLGPKRWRENPDGQTAAKQKRREILGHGPRLTDTRNTRRKGAGTTKVGVEIIASKSTERDAQHRTVSHDGCMLHDAIKQKAAAQSHLETAEAVNIGHPPDNLQDENEHDVADRKFHSAAAVIDRALLANIVGIHFWPVSYCPFNSNLRQSPIWPMAP